MIRNIFISRVLSRVVVVLVCTLALCQGATAALKYNVTPACQQAYKSVLMLRFSDARALLDREKLADPDNLIPDYIGNYIDFLTLFAGEDRNSFDRIKGNRDKCVARLEKGDRSSPYYRFCLADVNIQWAFARLKFREYTTAGLELRRANELLKENRTLHPGFLPNRLGLGVVYSLAGVIPENYRWLSSLIGLEGNLEQGITELEGVVRYNGNDPFYAALKVPGCLLAALINISLRNDRSAALAMISRFDTDPTLAAYASSPLVLYAKSSIYLKTGNSEMAVSLLSGRQHAKGTYNLAFLDYIAGVARLNSLDPAAAESFKTFLREFTGENYIKSAWQKLAWIALLEGDTAGYRKNIAMAMVLGDHEVDADKQAYEEASSGKDPAVPLLRARLLCDGGYYQKSLDVLLNQRLNQYIREKKDLAEYYYRLGRIYQALEQDGRALQNYRLAIQHGKNLPQYFAAGAALQMGAIQELNREYAKADSCYRICLSMENKEYKTSLSQKAKAGLNRIKKNLP